MGSRVGVCQSNKNPQLINFKICPAVGPCATKCVDMTQDGEAVMLVVQRWIALQTHPSMTGVSPPYVILI